MVRKIVLAAALAASLAGCKPSEPLVVTNIQTGKALNSDNSVATHTTRFGPRDTMFVSVLTGDRGSGTIEVRWSLGGRVLHAVKKDVSYLKPAATEFRFQTADAFPAGSYRVEVLVDGQPAGTRSLTVE